MKSALTLADQLEAELYLKPTGYTTVLTVEPGGTQNDLDFGACVYEIVVLDTDGKSIAYRYSDDSINQDWQIGTLGEVADLVVTTQIERITDSLTDEDIADWHSGEAGDIFTDLVQRFGVFQVWGSRTGSEPLTITAGE